MGKVYALFVGIDQYPPPVKALEGSVADITAMESLFTARIPPGSLALKTLRDGEATRAAMIDGFRSHLRQARENDVALFYYCGHGSQEPCPAEWLQTEPGGKNQTLIPVDARTGDVFDLADKELSALIHEVAAGGAQVVVITDSCNSGGNTRAVESDTDPLAPVARMAPASQMRPRTLDDYLDVARTLYDPARVAESGPPAPRHIAIAACQGDQLAQEAPWHQVRRGVFSAAFEEAVRALGPSATYVDLVNAVRMKVRNRANDQMPNLFVSGDVSGHDLFLGGHAGRSDLTLDADKAGRWWISAGAIDGVPSPAEGVTEIAIYERGALDAAAGATPIAKGIVVEVLEDRARLKLSGDDPPLDPLRQYNGAIARLATPSLNVIIEAPAGSAAADRVRARLTGSSPLFTVIDRAASGSAPSTVSVPVGNETVQVRGSDGTLLAGLAFATDEAGLTELVRCCTHLARWYGLRDRSPAGSRLNGAVRIEIVPVAAGEATAPKDRPPVAESNGSVALQYDGDKGPRVQFRLRNDAKWPLYVTLLALSDTFNCAKMFSDWIPGHGTGFVAGGKTFPMNSAGPSATDYFQAVVSIVEFDPERWNLPALLKPAATRSIGPAEEPAGAPDEPAPAEAIWGTTLLKVVTTK